MLNPDDLTCLNFKKAVATHMIGPYTSRKRAAGDNNIRSKKTYCINTSRLKWQTTF